MDTEVIRMTEFDGELIRRLFGKTEMPCPEPDRGFFGDEKNIMLVARTGEEESGFLWAYLLPRPERTKPMMYLYSIDVFEPFRRRGIGTILMQQLKEIARAHDCYKMFLQTGKSNVAAVALYRGTGGFAREDDDGYTFTYDREALGE